MFQHPSIADLTPSFWLITGYLAVFATMFAFFIQLTMIRRTSPVRVGTYEQRTGVCGGLFSVTSWRASFYRFHGGRTLYRGRHVVGEKNFLINNLVGKEGNALEYVESQLNFENQVPHSSSTPNESTIMASKRFNHFKGLSMVLLGAVLWGVSGTAAQVLFQHYGLNPGWLVTVRMSVAGLLLLAGISMRSGVTHTFEV